MKTGPAFTQILEPLEDRIAPASATFVDVDNDKVTITTTGPATHQNIIDAVTGGAASQIEKIDLTGAVFQGASIKVYVSERVAGGDGVVNVWAIDATGRDLGAVEVGGDLAKLTAGDGTHANGSVKSVKVQSIGVNGGAADKVWSMLGGTTAFNVAGDVNGAKLTWSNPDAAGVLTVKSVAIGGSLIGGTSADSGSILLSAGAAGKAELKSVSVGGNLVSTDYNNSGSILVGNTASPTDYTGNIGKAVIGGNLKGDNDKTYSGTLFAATNLGATTVGGSLTGGGQASGAIFSASFIVGDVSISGSLSGGAGIYGGSVVGFYGTKAVKVGGFANGAGGAYGGGVVSPLGSLGDVTIGSCLSGGSGAFSGSIYGQSGLGNAWVGGSVFGGSNDLAGMIGTTTGVAFKTGDITVKGSLFGGSGTSTGIIKSDIAGNIHVDGSLVGGSVNGTGSIYLSKSFESCFVGGDLASSNNSFTASIRALDGFAKASSLVIGGSILGNAAANSAYVFINGSVDNVSIGNDIIAGAGQTSASLSIGGDIKTLTIGGDIDGSASTAASGAFVNLHKVMNATVGGSLTGGAGADSGTLTITDGKSLSIGGGITGGSGTDSGSLNYTHLKNLSVGTGGNTGASIFGGSAQFAGVVHGQVSGNVTLAGNVVGGSAQYTGTAILGNANNVSVGGNIVGGASSVSGYVTINDVKGKVTVGGDLVGSADFSTTGGLFVTNAKTVEIKGSVIGGNTSMAGITNSGFVEAGSINSLTIGGSIKGGTAFNPTDFNLGSVRADKIIGTMLVKGDIIGTASQYVAITAMGDTTKKSGANLAIKSLTVNGSVSYANILGGYSTSGTTLNGNGGANGGSAQLGTVTVLGDFFNSSIATGVSNNNAAKNHWADNANVLLSKPAGSSIAASIAKIVIKGNCFAGIQNGIAAEKILSVTVGNSLVPIGTGAQFINPISGNFKAQQVVA